MHYTTILSTNSTFIDSIDLRKKTGRKINHNKTNINRVGLLWKYDKFIDSRRKKSTNRIQHKTKRKITLFLYHFAHRDKKDREKMKLFSPSACECVPIHIWKGVFQSAAKFRAYSQWNHLFSVVVVDFTWFVLASQPLKCDSLSLCVCVYTFFLLLILLSFCYSFHMNILCMKIIFKYTQWHFVDGI